MNLDNIRNGESVTIDANVFLYAMQQESEQCKRFLTRCAQEEIIGVLPVHILAEVTHQLMIAEARDNGWIKGSNPARQLAEQPERVRALTRYETLVRDILGIGLSIEPIEREDFITAMGVQRQSGLLTNDALLVAVGQRLRTNSIASADKTFSRVNGILLYSPDDLLEL
jgi:predicted nucleic acid-binding protein